MRVLHLHWDGHPHPFNTLEPRLPCFDHELLPPAPLAELLRRALAPDLEGRTWADLGIARIRSLSPAKILVEGHQWQSRVINRLDEILKSL